MIVPPAAPLVPVWNSIRSIPGSPLFTTAALAGTVRTITGTIGPKSIASVARSARTLFTAAALPWSLGTNPSAAFAWSSGTLDSSTAFAWSFRTFDTAAASARPRCRQSTSDVTSTWPTFTTATGKRSRVVVQECCSCTASQRAACECSTRPDVGSRTAATAEVEKVIEVASRGASGTGPTTGTEVTAARSRCRSIRDVARVDSARPIHTAARSRTRCRQAPHIRTADIRPVGDRAAAARGPAHLWSLSWTRHRWSAPCPAATVTTASASATTTISAASTATSASSSPAATATETTAATAAARPNLSRYPGDCRQQANGYEDVAFHDRT